MTLSFVRLSSETLAVVGGLERTQRSTGVPHVSSPVKNFSHVKFMLAAGAYSWRP